MIFNNPFKKLDKLMTRWYNPISGYAEHDDHVEIFVDKKLEMKEIYTHVMDDSTDWDVDDIAPEMVNGKPTKVIEIGEIHAYRDDKEYDPVLGGCMIRPHGAGYYGTLGVIAEAPVFAKKYLVGGLKSFKRILDTLGIRYDYKPVILTNAHVTQKDVMKQEVGGVMVQPGKFNNVVGKVLWSSPFSKHGSLIDASVCSVDTPTYKNQVIDVGSLRGPRIPRVGEQVHKYGATTEYTDGSVRNTNARVNVRYSDDLVIPFTNVYLFSRMSAPGDSGSVIVAKEDGRPVSLLFAGSSVVTIGCNLNRVVEKAGVRIGNEE